MEEVSRLVLREPVTVDPDRLVELCVSMGECQAEAMVTTAIEELARGMVEVEAAYRAQNMDALSQRADILVKTARHIGMTSFAQVADDVLSCAQGREAIALSATLTRLRRIADRSLTAMWEMQDISI